MHIEMNRLFPVSWLGSAWPGSAHRDTHQLPSVFVSTSLSEHHCVVKKFQSVSKVALITQLVSLLLAQAGRIIYDAQLF